MWNRMLSAACIAAAIAIASPALAWTKADYLGNWLNEDPDTRSIVRILVTNGPANKVTVHVWGKCHPTPCDWGTVLAPRTFRDGVWVYRAHYTPGFATKNVMLEVGPAGTLTATTDTHFTDGSGRADYTSVDTFHH